MIIVSQTYKIGINTGEYPPGSKITDFLIGLAPISSISYNLQTYNVGEGWSQDTANCVFNIGDLGPLSSGQTITINFKTGIQIN